MSTNKYDPPEFFSDPSGYAEYKKRLKRWARITNVAKKKQAEVVVYHLEGHPSGIQEINLTQLLVEISKIRTMA